MDSDEEKKQSESFISKSKEKMQSANEKMQKAKRTFKIFMKLPPPVKIAIIVIPLVVIILLVIFLPGATFLMGILGYENVLNTKASAMESIGTDSNTYSSEIIKLENGSWNLSMSDTIKDKLTDNGVDISGKDENELLLEVLKLYGLDDEYLSKDEMNLLPYLIKAEIATQKLDLRTEDEMYPGGTYNPPDTSDMENSTEIYGTVHLKRVNSKDKSTTYLSYVDYETFKSYSNNKDEAIKHFSFNDNGSAVIYTWNHIKYTYDNQKGVIEVPDSAKKENVDQVNLQETVISDYESLIKKYTLPFEVLTALLINSEDINFTKEVADLAFKANIEISLIEEYEYTKTTNTTKYYKTTRGYQHVEDGRITLNGESIYTYTGLIEKYTDNENREVSCTHSGDKKHGNKFTYFTNHYTDSSPSYTIVETIEQETNTYKYGVTLADCWFVKVEKEIEFEAAITEGSTSEGEKTKNQYTCVKEDTKNGEDAINNIKDEDTKKEIVNKVTAETNSIKNGVSIPEVTFDFDILLAPKLNVTHNVKITSVKVYQPAAIMQGGVFTSYPNSTTASVEILGRDGVVTPGTSSIYPITKIVIKDINNNTFEFNGSGNVTGKSINVNKQYNITLKTYEYILTDEQTTAVTSTTKYPITDGTTSKDLYDSKDEKFLKAYGENGKARGNIGSTPGWMEEMIDEYNPEFTTIMTYLLDMYKYDVDINSVLNLFDIQNFQNLTHGLSCASIYNYMRAWECNALYKYYIGESKECAKYVDGEYYKVYYGGSADPTYNLAYGIVISRSYNDNYFSQKGVSSSALRSYQTDGEKFTELTGKEIEDIFQQIVDKHKNAVESLTSGLNLSQNQKDALTAIKYQYGNIGNFKSAYEEYYLKGDIEGFKQNFRDSQGYQPLLDTSNNNKEGRISNRVKANLKLFVDNQYTDMNGNAISTVGGDASNAVYIALTFEGKQGNEMFPILGYEGEWCAAFACYCYEKVGIIPSVIDKRYTYCPDLMDHAKEKGIWHDKSGYTPKSGDMILFDWDSNGDPNHVGLVKSCDGSYVYTVEGNRGGSNYNYTCVKTYSYSISNGNILGYISPTN